MTLAVVVPYAISVFLLSIERALKIELAEFGMVDGSLYVRSAKN
jgi:hypothetical protein